MIGVVGERNLTLKVVVLTEVCINCDVRVMEWSGG